MQEHRRYDVIVVGAGPVGLLLAGLLARDGLRCLVVERSPAPPRSSMAIGITPPSLQILSRLGLEREFVERGVAVDTAVVHEGGREIGRVHFDGLPARFPFILSLPQSETVVLLEDSLKRSGTVRLERGVELVGVEDAGDGVRARLRDTHGIRGAVASAAFLVGCDGHASTVRSLAGIHARTRAYRPTFVMGDFEDSSGLGAEAHLYFSSRGSVESFPLPEGLRRWVALNRSGSFPPPEGHLIERVLRLTGHDLRGSARHTLSPFAVRHLLCRAFHRGRVALCGDAAHVMSPIGGQGMNTGFADAELLAAVLVRTLRGALPFAAGFSRYEAVRRRAFRIAAARAARGMWLGTRTGTVGSCLRGLLIRHVLLRRPVAERLPSYFAMLTLPSNTLAGGRE